MLISKQFRKWAESDVQQLKVFSDNDGKRKYLGKLNYYIKTKTSDFTWSDEALDLKEEWSPIRLKLQKETCIPQNLPLDFEGLPGLFNDSLPDGWGKRLMDKSFIGMEIRPKFLTPAFRLALIGNKALGSLSYEPIFKQEESTRLSLDHLLNEIDEVIKGHPEEVSHQLLLTGGSPHGARPKVVLDVSPEWNQAYTPSETGVPREGFESWMIKFASRDENHQAPIIEKIYMELAEKMGLEVQPSKLLNIKRRLAFATKRFDRESNKKIFIHSLSGITEKSHMEPTGLDYSHIADILKFLKADPSSLEEGFKRMVFNLLFCNRDDHAKNFSFMKKNHQWSLTPAYDITYMEGFYGLHQMSFAGSVEKEHNYKDILKLSESYEVSKTKMDNILRKGIYAMNQFKDLAKQYELNDDLTFWIDERLQEISKNIKIPKNLPKVKFK
jgi:serine/threonine-protein kinase HipA